MVGGACTQSAEDRIAIPQLFIKRVRKNLGAGSAIGAAAGLRWVADDNQLLRIFHRQHLQQQSIQNREDRCVRPISQRQCEDGHQSESWVPAKLAHCVADVLTQIHSLSSLVPQRLHGIYAGCSPRRNVGGDQSNSGDARANHCHHQGITRPYSVQHAFQNRRRC